MRIFNKLVFSKKEPYNKNDIWFDGKEWKVFIEGEWKDTSKFKEDATTPDWNAQEGEAGYIENRPFERKNIEPFISNNEVVYNTPDLMDVYIQCYDSIYSFPFGYDDYGIFIESEKEIYIVEDDVSIKARRSEYEIRVQNLTNELDVNYITNLITVFYVDRKLNQSDIDNTVIKTTPQTLSDDDKNQALANLGIKIKADGTLYIEQ